tara:strand:- start:324 stop:578 length:255 start_codon:yes stop_codon:yes gene_type:complete
MIDTERTTLSKYEDAKKMVEDAGLIDDNDGWLDVHYRKIAHLLAEVKRLRKLEDVVREAFSEDSKYASGEYMNMMGEILGVIER